jgi:hypothetical protein
MLRKDRHGLQLTWKTTGTDTPTTLRSFVDSVVGPRGRSAQNNGSMPATVLGLDSTSVAFYRIDIPAVSDAQLNSIVPMQAESILPLPAEHMKMAWRAAPSVNGKRSCSVVAAQSSQLAKIVADAGPDVSRILLDTEALARAWMELFDSTTERVVLVNLRPTDCQVLLMDGGKLSHAVTVNTGLNDFASDGSSGNNGLFVYDLRDTLELFGPDVPQDTPLLVISENPREHEKLISYLRDAGFNARPTVPSSGLLYYARPDAADIVPSHAVVSEASGHVTSGDICQYIEPIGLALMAMDGDAVGLDLFQGLMRKPGASTARTVGTLTLLAVATVVIAVVCMVVARKTDEKQFAGLTDIGFNKLIEHRTAQELVASQRPDILGLITAINDCASEGMMLDSFEYKAGKVTISSFANSREQIYEFEKKLNAKDNISDVQIISPTFDEKKKRVDFKMQFKYTNPFSK